MCVVALSPPLSLYPFDPVLFYTEKLIISLPLHPIYLGSRDLFFAFFLSCSEQAV